MNDREVLGVLASMAVGPVGPAIHGSRPDYGVGPHMELMAAAVRLARRDLCVPVFQTEARAFLDGPLVALFKDCLGYGGRL